MSRRLPSTHLTAGDPTRTAYILSPVFVLLVAWIVAWLQRAVVAADHGAYANPNSIAFLLPIALITLRGGRGPGIATVLLSALACFGILLHSRRGFDIEFYSGLANLTFMVAAGGVVISGLDSLRRATILHKSVADHALAIASAFQERLIPRLPTETAGLTLAYHYEPALDEALVGGDFVDAFTTARNELVMVLGDISGKGLAAATQVSTVKNMLRFALYRVNTIDLAKTIGDISDAIAAQNLLTGFATVFVGIYDPRSLTLTYVSCGHEPGFVRRRVGGEVVELPATGMVLGAFLGAKYDTRSCVVNSGDTLVLYTDGLSESGVNRTQMLGSSGIKQLVVAALDEDRSPKSVVRRIIDHAKAVSGGRLNDDACLLVCSPMPLSDAALPSIELANPEQLSTVVAA